jgi:hypothetical protein
MIRLHVSKERFLSADKHEDPRVPTPACGATDGVHVIKFGYGDGLVRYPALSPEFHCSDCVRIKRDEAYGIKGRG